MGAMCRMMSPESVLVGFHAQDKEEVIRALVDALVVQGKVSDGEVLYHDVMDREELSSTALGLGCAVPHAHSQSMESTYIAAAQLEEPIDFGASDGKPVSLVFLMAGPKNNSGLHLKLLSKIARFLHDATLRDRLMEAENSQVFQSILCEKDG